MRQAPAEASCQGKESMTNEHARRISESMRKRGRGQVQHYHCQHCGAWHVGNGTPRMPDRRRQGYGKNQFDGGA